MKRIKKPYVIIFCLLTIYCSNGQELNVKSFSKCDDDLSARTEKRFDANGNLCALIKVSVVSNCEFGGSIVGKVDRRIGMYWVYVCAISPTTRKIIVSPDNYLPLTVVFKDYGIDSVESGFTYSLVLESKNKISATNEIKGHKYVDLGLSVFWADCNVGAAYPEEFGGLYGWGDSSGKRKSSNENDYPNDNPPSNICGSEYDIARTWWGGGWRLPSKDELTELIEKCLIHSAVIENVPGATLIGPSGDSIFIPYAGSFDHSTEKYNYVRAIAYLWSGDYEIDKKDNPYFLELSQLVIGLKGLKYKTNKYVKLGLDSFYPRSGRLSVRPVCKRNTVLTENYYKSTLANRKVLIKGQINNYLLETEYHPPKIFIRNAESNELLYTLTEQNTREGIFEIKVYDGINLKFEAEGFLPMVIGLSDNIKVILKKDISKQPKFPLG